MKFMQIRKDVIELWSYYGRKTKVIKMYPNPQYDIIVEPFAGTAVYSLYDKLQIIELLEAFKLGAKEAYIFFEEQGMLNI